MKNSIKIFVLLVVIAINSSAQNDTIKLKEVIVSSSRIELPFSENSKAITIISNEYIKNIASTNLTDLLQNVSGIDIRRRGVEGMQSDIYIRGGSFEQTLILIDGIKTDDPQTGHHTMNAMLPLETIERIEIIKGPSARIFGQNAFTGAINIVTKKEVSNKLIISLKGGAFEGKGGSITGTKEFEKSNYLVHYSYNSSDGYRDNTDFKNYNVFLKSNFKTKNESISIIASFADRKFGANNFYTNDLKYNEYEETQTSLVGIFTKYKFGNFIFKPKVYWRRNQDMFLLKRDVPSYSRNLNISNKIGAELNSSLSSDIGITGFGLEFNEITLASNNLGNQDRTIFSAFLEHRFSFINNKLDITPGISVNHYSDFDFQTFPGIDIGYKLSNNSKLYYNIGKSYRIPSYIELFNVIPGFLSGSSDLKPEKAKSQEFGFKYSSLKLSFNSTAFYRKSTDLIDYIKETSESPVFIAQNLREIITKGVEFDVNYNFVVTNFNQSLNLGYTFIDDDYKNTNVYESRYLINTSIKHQFVVGLSTQLINGIKQNISYRYIERPTNNYNIVDVKISADIKDFQIYAMLNNIFNTVYSEKDFVPMPKGNLMIGIAYKVY